jgi:hypothetical protein
MRSTATTILEVCGLASIAAGVWVALGTGAGLIMCGVAAVAVGVVEGSR